VTDLAATVPTLGADGLYHLGSRVVCGARNRRGGYCGRPPARGRTRCRLHGGASLVGTASGTFKHGRHSKYLPTRLLQAYKASRTDPNLVVLRDELALVDARLGELLANVETDGWREQWQHAKHAFDAWHQANQRGDADAQRAALQELHGALTHGLSDHAKWDAIAKLLETRRRLTETEQRRLERAHHAMTKDQAMVLLARTVDTIRRHVKDPVTLSAIAVDLQAIANHQPQLYEDNA
jgi:hypothetical protein